MTADESGLKAPAANTPDNADRGPLSKPTAFSEPESQEGSWNRAIRRLFTLLRVAIVVYIGAALAMLVALNVHSTGWPAWVTMGLFLAYLAFTGETVLRLSQRIVDRERQRAARVFQNREAELQDIASRDDLTRLQNRRFFYQRLQTEIERAERTRKQLALIIIDVDDLKAINDEFGHQVGDAVLSQFARILNRTVGPGHVTARLGGDEFAIILPQAGRREADQVAWRIWDALNAAPLWENSHASIYLGASIGVGGFPWGGTNLEEVIHWADAKLYANKLERKGFNRRQGSSNDHRLSSAVVEVLSTALDIRDNMTHRHARRVARMAAAVAEAMKLEQHQVLEIEYAAALHDIGKIGVADSILRKAAPLDEEEWKEMRRHSELGYEILRGIDFLTEAAEIVWAHHERYDGGGYPRGLAGEEIPLGARVFAVVDAYDAMTSRRPYRQAMSREEACVEIARHAGRQFDPEVVQAFLRTIWQMPEGEYEEGEGHTSINRNERPNDGAAGAKAKEREVVGAKRP